jgi:hypothetical protein
MMVVLIALDELYNIRLFDPIWLELSASLVQKKKNTIFDPIKVALFPSNVG